MNTDIYRAPKTITNYHDSHIKIVHPSFPQEKVKPLKKKHPIEKMFNVIKRHIKERVNIEHISKELTYVFICLSLFIFVGNDGVNIKNSSLYSIILYSPMFAAIYLMAKASFKSMLIGILCLFFGVYLNSHFKDFSWLLFINKEHLPYLTGLGVIFTSFSLIKSD